MFRVRVGVRYRRPLDPHAAVPEFFGETTPAEGVGVHPFPSNPAVEFVRGLDCRDVLPDLPQTAFDT